MASRTVRLFAVAALVVAAGACSKKLDTEGLETPLQDQIEAETGEHDHRRRLPQTTIKVEAGTTFECTVTEESGATFTVEVVTQTDDAGKVS